MAQGMALNIGLNSVDPTHYDGWSGELAACEADAMTMIKIAQSQGFTGETLLTEAATRDTVMSKIAKAAKSLKPGDIFLLSYSGHGGQLPDLNGDEPDGEDETWCLYDGELVDDELYLLFGQFQEDVRILMFSDSCHSGTVAKEAFLAAMGPSAASRQTGQEPVYRRMPRDVSNRTYYKNQAFYDKILLDPKLTEAEDQVKASVLLISGCQDNQLSSDGTFNGLFTGTMARVWNGGKFKRDYRAFHAAILDRMPPDQSPNYFTVGKPARDFERQRPFSI